MELYELIAYRVSTACVAIVSFVLFYELYRRYKDGRFAGSLLLSLHVLCIGLTYLTILLLRPQTDAATATGLILSYVCFATGGLIPYFGALFSLYALEPEHKKIWMAAVTLLEVAYLAALFVFPPVVVEVRQGYFEWKASALIRQFGFDYALAVLWAVPVVLFVAFTFRARERKDRVKGILLGSSMALLLFFILICEGTTGWIPIAVRRTLTAASVISLYLGFVMPDWFSGLVGLDESPPGD
jgi:hypothetical protein